MSTYRPATQADIDASAKLYVRVSESRPWPTAGPVMALLAERCITSVDAQAEATGMSTAAIKRWRADPSRRIFRATADRVAKALGYHPSELWRTT